jgi:pimeloyl-ACP methyl ester carboxylesterase
VTGSLKHKLSRGLHGQLLFSDFGSWVLRQLITFAPLYTIKRVLERESNYGARLRLEARKILEDDAKRNFVFKTLEQCMPASQRLPGLLNDAEKIRDFTNVDLQNVCCPTLIIHGTCDGEVPFSHAEHASKTIGNSMLIAVPDACHLLCVSDRWELIKKARRRFFKAITDGAPDPFCGITLR